MILVYESNFREIWIKLKNIKFWYYVNDLYNLKVYFSEFYIDLELLSIDFRLIESS